ncbi:hypothetical protein PsYK624_046730 [Phanerochaete sordida]|uniref:Uncharacterized protein n=1 Tax=Phanerochaete sordida TaxID=48140 RepID=A0A9P3G6T1_9APHY|nr:hypothetical protein PsYK624_046730 [Phanerochaete sordida]
MHLDRRVARHDKRQTPVPSISGFDGAVTVGQASPTASGLILASGTDANDGPLPTAAPPLASDFTPTVSVSTLTDPLSSPPAVTSNSAALKGSSSSSSVALSTVIAACVGAFAGMALLVCIFIWWSRHPTTKSRNLPRSPMAENRNARGREEQERTRSGLWDRLDENKWEGGSAAVQPMSQQEADEKNFSMFKKRSNSTRTTRTAKVMEEHGFDLPPIEISKYHPGLAKELALEQPERPYAARQESGVSWDGETLGDDSFLSLRSVRIESGAMSPTMGMAKMTPPAMPSQLHRWESAEVLTIGDSPTAGPSEISNPFSDAYEDKRKSHSNPFFNAGGVNRVGSRRSRSNSRGHARRPSRSQSTVRPRVVSEVGSTIDPFADLADPPPAIALPDVVLPDGTAHEHSLSVTSEDAEEAFVESDRAMQSLIAALDLGQQSDDARLRVQSTHSAASVQPSPASRYSFQSDDVGVARDYPPSPVSPQAR